MGKSGRGCIFGMGSSGRKFESAGLRKGPFHSSGPQREEQGRNGARSVRRKIFRERIIIKLF